MCFACFWINTKSKAVRPDENGDDRNGLCNLFGWFSECFSLQFEQGMDGAIMGNVRIGDRYGRFGEGGRFALQIGHDFLITEIGRFLYHQPLRAKNRMRYSQDEHSDALVFILNLEAILPMLRAGNHSKIPQLRKMVVHNAFLF